MTQMGIFSTSLMTNDDFRQLLMTRRGFVSTETPASVSEIIPDASAQTPFVSGNNQTELRRKKRSYYAKLNQQKDDRMAELAAKYRDRARERREGLNQEQVEDPSINASAYRAVAPDLKSNLDAAERRRQMIQHSKYLGGDMEHTHLVKGLDFALLRKVRSEIQDRENEENKEEKHEKPTENVEERKEPENKSEFTAFKSRMGCNIYNTVMSAKSKIIKRNELFTPGRMTYLFDLGSEDASADIPTTVINSKADVSINYNSVIITSDIVVNKLSEIFSYIRQGGRQCKKNTKNEDIRSKPEELASKKLQGDSIYGDIGEYVPHLSKSESSQNNKKKDSYFDKPLVDLDEKENDAKLPKLAAILDATQRKAVLLDKLANEPDSYVECYPGFVEMQDAISDLDDDADTSKMDNGNKKSSNKQTGKVNTKKKETAKLDREWQKIQNIHNDMKKRKFISSEGPKIKVPRY